MSVEKCSEKEIEEVIKKFKTFLTIIVRSATIDFARKMKWNNAVKEIVFTDLVDRNVSLSVFDSDIFLPSEEIETDKLENIVSNNQLKSIIQKLSNDEKKILYFGFIEELSNSEIAIKMNLTEKTVRNKKSIIKAKIKANMEDFNNENRYE